MTMITRKRLGELADELTTVVGAWAPKSQTATRVLNVAAELRVASVEPSEIPAAPGVPFAPPAHYAAGGASMVDAIEMLESKLGTIELIIDAHRAALVAAGWLDVNGEPVAPARPKRVNLIDKDGDLWHDCGDDRYAGSEPWSKAKIEREYGPVRDAAS